MEIITVHTTQNIDIDYEIGGLGERILARLIDFGVFIPLVFAGIFLATALSRIGIGIYFITILLLFTFYDLLCEVFFNGQSLGKRVMKIRVISIDGARPKFSQYLLRWLFRVVDFSITGGIAALITAAVSEKGQRIGDIVAGTALIKTVPRTKMDNLIFKTADDDYQPVFTQVSQLNDQDISLVHDVIQNYLKTGNSHIVYTMADKMRQHLSISMPPDMDSMKFLQTILKDYSHITAHADVL